MSFMMVCLLAALAPAADAPPAKDVAAFRAACAARAATADKANQIAVVGKGGFLFLARELRHVGVGKFWGAEAKRVSKATNPASADPLPAILDFKKQLDKAGIELLVVPVPPKVIVYPDLLSAKLVAGKGGPPRLDTAHQAFYALLRKQGVKVLDVTEGLTALRGSKAGEPYCRGDSHWSGAGCELAARRIAAEIKDRPWLKGVPRLKLVGERKRVTVEGDLARSREEDLDRSEALALRFVGVKGEGTPVAPDRRSPVVLLGDSHNLIFHSGGDMLAKGAGLPDQLALELGFAVDLVGVRGSGATPARVNLLRLARADKKYLGGKKLVVWCFSAREFTESAGWQKVPIVK